VGAVNARQIYEIAISKQRDANLKDIGLKQLCRTVAGQAASMGIRVEAMAGDGGETSAADVEAEA